MGKDCSSRCVHDGGQMGGILHLFTYSTQFLRGPKWDSPLPPIWQKPVFTYDRMCLLKPALPFVFLKYNRRHYLKYDLRALLSAHGT